MSEKTAKAPVQPIRQSTQYNCMAASLSMCLRALGKRADTSTEMVNKVMGARPMRGASWEQCMAAAQHYGARTHLTMPATLRQVKEWTDKGIPVMIAWNPEGRDWSHASVIFDVDDEFNVHIADPNIPDPDETVRVLSKSEFYGKWYEKWPDYMVRRPAMAVSLEVTPEGKQVLASRNIEEDRDTTSLGAPMTSAERVATAYLQSEAGKKHRRRVKDRGMSDKLKGKGKPKTKHKRTENEKAEATSAWKERKEQGNAGMPGAGRGGPHKGKGKGKGRKKDRQDTKEELRKQRSASEPSAERVVAAFLQHSSE